MDDYIRRQTAIKTALTFFVEYLGGAFHEDMQAILKKRFEEVPSADVQKWIPCSERLPKDHEAKLLTHEVHYITGKVIKDVRMAYYDDDNDEWMSDEESPEILCYPLAWMPLPEPYKDGEQND